MRVLWAITLMALAIAGASLWVAQDARSDDSLTQRQTLVLMCSLTWETRDDGQIIVSLSDSAGYQNCLDTGGEDAKCAEDDPCWDCKTMGNRICGPVTVPDYDAKATCIGAWLDKHKYGNLADALKACP